MKKFIFSIFLLLSYNALALAAIDCSQYEEETDCIKIAGCTYASDTCVTCSSGNYSAANSNQCNACEKPANASFTGPGTSATTCPWKLTCDKDTYWNSGSKACVSCPDYYESAGTEITYTGEGTWPQTQNTCTGKEKEVTLYRNCIKNGTTTKESLYVKMGNGFRLDKQSDWTAQPGTKDLFWCWGKTFSGFFTEINTGGQQVISASGNLVNPPVKDASYFFTENISELYAHWDAKPYQVKYFNSSEDTSPIRTQTCYIDSECTAQSPINAQSGKILLYWQCEENCSGTITAGATIPEPTEGNNPDLNPIKLIAVWGDCPSGYYCTSGNKTPCPAGSTSDEGSSAKSNCHIVRGTSGTKFCDGDGCFTLPGDGNIPWARN